MPKKLADTISYPLYTVMGAMFSLAALLLVRALSRHIETLPVLSLLFVSVLIVSGLSAWVIRMALRPDRLSEAMAVIALSGLLIDSVLFSGFPYAVGPDERIVRVAAGWRLFTAASLLLSGILLEHRGLISTKRSR